jgi:hypothetical protein
MARRLFKPFLQESLDQTQIYSQQAEDIMKKLFKDQGLKDAATKLNGVIAARIKKEMAEYKITKPADVDAFAQALGQRAMASLTGKPGEAPSLENMLSTSALMVSYTLKSSQKEAQQAEESAPAEETQETAE